MNFSKNRFAAMDQNDDKALSREDGRIARERQIAMLRPAIEKLLMHLGLPHQRPQLTPARAPPQTTFDCDESAEDDCQVYENDEPIIQVD